MSKTLKLPTFRTFMLWLGRNPNRRFAVSDPSLCPVAAFMRERFGIRGRDNVDVTAEAIIAIHDAKTETVTKFTLLRTKRSKPVGIEEARYSRFIADVDGHEFNDSCVRVTGKLALVLAKQVAAMAAP